MNPELLFKNMLELLPLWSNKIVKPFRQSLEGKMSLELYYCMQLLMKYEPLTMTEIAQRLNMTKQSATKVINKLYSIKFIERIPDISDRRIIQIHTTDLGKDYIDKKYCQDFLFVESVERGLTPQEMAEMNQAFETLTRLLPKL